MRRFFEIRQDKLLSDVVQLKQFDIRGARHIFYKQDLEKVNATTVMYTKEGKEEIFPDFLESPVFMISEQMKTVIDMYEDDMFFPRIPLIRASDQHMNLYYHLLLEPLDAISEQSLFYDSGNVERLVLDQMVIGKRNVFMLNDRRFSHPFVSLEVVESLLRRRVIGMEFKEVEVC